MADPKKLKEILDEIIGDIHLHQLRDSKRLQALGGIQRELFDEEFKDAKKEVQDAWKELDEK